MVAEGKRMIKPIQTRHPSLKIEPETEVMEPLSPVSRLFHEPQLHCYIILKFGIKALVDAGIFKTMVIANFMKHPRFSSKLVFDAMGTRRKAVGWVQTKVNVDDHIIVPNLDPNMEEPDKFVEDYVSNIAKNNPIMDLSKPLWEFHILNNVKTSDCTSVIVMRLHHSLGDGVSIVSLIIACCRKISDPHVLPLPSLRIARQRKKQRVNIIDSSSRFLRYNLVFLKVWYNTFVDVVMFVATLVFLKDTNTPLKGASNIRRTVTRFVHRHLSLDDLKLVKNATNTTINDVVLGITLAGLSRYLTRCYGKDGKDTKLKHVRLTAAVITNLRAKVTIEDLAKIMEVGGRSKGHQWGNSIAFLILPLLVSLKDDPLDYIRSAKATMDRKKQSSEAPLASSFGILVQNTLGIEAASCLTYKALVSTTVCFSNVVGPSEELSLAGYPVAFLAPTVYGLPGALMIHFFSYMGKIITLSIGVNDDIIPNPHELCDDIAESLELAKNALCIRSASKL